MQKLFEISVEPHLVKFAVKEFWESTNSPFPIDEGSRLGKQILLFLIDKRHKQAYTVAAENSTISVVLSDTLAKRSPDLIKLSRINEFLEEEFKSKLHTWVRAQVLMGNGRYQSVVSFMKFHKIDPAQMIQRYYQYIMRLDNRDHSNRKKKFYCL